VRQTILLLITLFVPALSRAQTLEDSAKEVWSEPMRIRSVAGAPSVLGKGDTLFFYDEINRIQRMIKENSVWQPPQKLSENFNFGLAKHPVITPDGRRLYFIDYGGYGGWDLWMTEWSDSLNDWGEAVNLGPPINTNDDEWCSYAPDNKALVFVRNVLISNILISNWIDSAGTWSSPVSFEGGEVSRGFGVSGLTLAKDRKKMYVGRLTYVNDFFEYELMVSYNDSVTGKWSKPLRLNINSHPPDSMPKYNPENRGYDAFPSITPDGIWIFFVSDRSADSLGTNYHDIYVSRLLVDENGDTVVTSVYDRFIESLFGVKLLQNFPNPFNPSTQFSFELAAGDHIRIVLFDIQGRKVMVLADSYFETGRHQINVDLESLPSGIYFYQLHGTRFQPLTKKMLYIH